MKRLFAECHRGCLLSSNFQVGHKPEVIRGRRPIVRNHDCLSPLVCVFALPEKWIFDAKEKIYHSFDNGFGLSA
jgi:hypothetical protein